MISESHTDGKEIQKLENKGATLACCSEGMLGSTANKEDAAEGAELT